MPGSDEGGEIVTIAMAGHGHCHGRNVPQRQPWRIGPHDLLSHRSSLLRLELCILPSLQQPPDSLPSHVFPVHTHHPPPYSRRSLYTETHLSAGQIQIQHTAISSRSVSDKRKEEKAREAPPTPWQLKDSHHWITGWPLRLSTGVSL